MASPKFYNLLAKVHEQTAAGRLRWQATAKDGAYRVGLGNGIIRVEKSIHFAEESFENEDCYKATLMDKNGKPVDELWDYEPLADSNRFMRDLFADARLSALNVDDLLDSMYKDIDAGKTRELPPEED